MHSEMLNGEQWQLNDSTVTIKSDKRLLFLRREKNQLVLLPSVNAQSTRLAKNVCALKISQIFERIQTCVVHSFNSMRKKC